MWKRAFRYSIWVAEIIGTSHIISTQTYRPQRKTYPICIGCRRIKNETPSLLPEQETQWRGDCVSFIAEEILLAGQLPVARQALLEAQALYETTRNRYATRATRLRIGEICFLQGELRQAAEMYRAVLTIAEEDRSDTAYALLGLAQLSL